MQLVTIMAGAAGEQLYFGQLSTGVEGDLDRASKLARSMVVSYGMSSVFGPVSIGEKAGEVFLGRDIQNLSNVSPVQQELVEGEVRRSVLFPGVHVGRGAVVEDSIVMHDTRISPGARLTRESAAGRERLRKR